MFRLAGADCDLVFTGAAANKYYLGLMGLRVPKQREWQQSTIAIVETNKYLGGSMK